MTGATPLALLPPSTAIAFRPVCLADAAELQRCCWPEQTDAQVFQRIARIVHAMQRQRGLGVVVMDGSSIVAYGQVARWFRLAEISDLIVVPERRSQGIGTALIQYLVQAAITLEVPAAEIGVAERNPRAFALYQRLGFRGTRTVMLDLGNGLEIVHYLWLDLPG